MAPTSVLEPLFQALTLDLLVPSTGSFPVPPKKNDVEGLRAWLEGLRSLETRETAFLDEKLSYAVAVTIPATDDSDEMPPEIATLVRQLQLTATASFLPPLYQQRAGDKQRRPGAPGSAPAFSGPTTGQTLTPMPQPASSGPASTSLSTRNDDAPPQTPVPIPASTPTTSSQQYAGMDGVVVWESLVEIPDSNRPVVVRTEEGWVAVWRGEMPVIYVRTQIQNPVLAITASATLRETGPKRRGTIGPADAASIYSTTTLHTDVDEGDDVDQVVDIAELEEIDLLGGLAEEAMPASRLGPSLRDDLSVRAPPSPVAYTPGTPQTSARTPRTPLTLSTTLRKSFRRVLALSPGLRVRMRTLFLPQLLPPSESGDAESDDAGERRIVLCIEIENGTEARQNAFEVEAVTVDVGGKGAKVGTSLLCQPGQEANPPAPVFPILLQHLEQYNLLYAVDVASTPNGGRGDEHRPVSIVLTGRPYKATAGRDTPGFMTASFQSRWNCALDLAPFYASLPPAPPAPQAHAPQARQMAHRLSKPTPPTPNAIAGDKRYSLAALMGDRDKDKTPVPGAPADRRLVSNPPRPILPSTANRVMSARGPTGQAHPAEGHGLLVSVKVLPPSLDAGISPLDTFSIEVFVHNRTDGIKRFRLSIPPRDACEGRVREAWAKRRQRTGDEPAFGADDAVLAALLTQHEAAAPSLIPLETDVRCGPLLPGASLAARIRFLALRSGVHRIERMRITGVGEEFDFVISPVLEVVVGVGAQ